MSVWWPTRRQRGSLPERLEDAWVDAERDQPSRFVTERRPPHTRRISRSCSGDDPGRREWAVSSPKDTSNRFAETGAFIVWALPNAAGMPEGLRAICSGARHPFWPWAGIVTVGGVIGSELGSRRAAPVTFRRLLAAVLVVAGLKLVFLV